MKSSPRCWNYFPQSEAKIFMLQMSVRKSNNCLISIHGRDPESYEIRTSNETWLNKSNLLVFTMLMELKFQDHSTSQTVKFYYLQHKPMVYHQLAQGQLIFEMGISVKSLAMHSLYTHQNELFHIRTAVIGFAKDHFENFMMNRTFHCQDIFNSVRKKEQTLVNKPKMLGPVIL